MRPHSLFFAFIATLTPAFAGAQDISIGNDDQRPIEERVIYNRETTAHASLNTQGLSLGFRIGKIKDIHKTTNWEVEVSYLRSLKQIKTINLYSGMTFVYGKLNDAVVVRGGYEVERRIYGKPYWGGVELRWLYGGGVSLALLKPYYYIASVISSSPTGGLVQSYEYRTFEEDLDIIGKAPFQQGLDEIKLRPGLYARSGMNFELGTSKTRAQSLEVGGMVECFPQGLALMAENPVERFIPTLYIAYSWGSRFNKY